jgi:hypothetical protein
MLSKSTMGVACLLLVYGPYSSFATAAGLGGQVPRRFEPEVSSYSNPAIWTGLYRGISSG